MRKVILILAVLILALVLPWLLWPPQEAGGWGGRLPAPSGPVTVTVTVPVSVTVTPTGTPAPPTPTPRPSLLLYEPPQPNGICDVLIAPLLADGSWGPWQRFLYLSGGMSGGTELPPGSWVVYAACGVPLPEETATPPAVYLPFAYRRVRVVRP